MTHPQLRWGAVGLLLMAGLGAAAPARADAGAGADAQAEADRDAAVAVDAAPSDAGGLPPAKRDATAQLAAVEGTCTQHVPEGKKPPTLTEQLPARSLSGHAALLQVVIEHGKGETVLPDGFRHQLGSDEMRALEEAGFILPDPDGGAGLSLSSEVEGERVKTTVRIPVVPLPPEPGRHELVLPPLPIAIARASGELVTVCTEPHRIVVDDPIANTPDPKPKDNPPPRRQLEEWTAAKQVVYASLIALVVGALVAWLLGKWLRRPKPAPPPTPPRPPWEVALEELHDLRLAGLIDDGRFAEHFDRVSFTARKYLGDRYGFDGLESTTREMLSVLRRVVPPIAALPQIERFLRKADLVKFARLTPTANECRTALEQGEEIVRRTIPDFVTSEGDGARASTGGPQPAAPAASGSFPPSEPGARGGSAEPPPGGGS